jgi:myo-inositol-1(or 4)-monophosphatase
MKAPSDYVTAADQASERAITSVLMSRHPEGSVVGEEFTAQGTLQGEGPIFVVDPLDGTTNFVHGFPWYAVSIGVLQRGVPVAAVVLNIPTGELFTATAGGGARRNGQPIHVSGITEPGRALIGTGAPFRDESQVEAYLRSLRPVLASAAGIRRAGAAALDLADVAGGRFEAFWELTLKPWDVAAGILLVREAGGIVTDLDGAPKQVDSSGIIAGNPAMHAWLAAHLMAGRLPSTPEPQQ